MTASVYARALGERFGMLHPELQRWFGSTAAVRASGIFDEAGSRHRWLRPVLGVTAKFGILMSEHGRHVPFEVEMAPVGASTIATRRVLHFARTDRILSDTTRVARGRLIDSFAGGRLQVEMVPDVAEGALIVHSARARLMLGRYPLPVPTPRVRLRHAWDADAAQHTIDVAVTVPVLGEVFGYRGHFTARNA
ncbi:DUF4166 domain-containing protein [Salinibacterium sp. dk2585]|uniref:DUF4166 domain-containing protein n=1 Tax=unclassified Salinibacterium TaxID=2632331 RepID=UPI0011C24EF4|nr:MULTISPECIES: DUF4166 domain-containing protein [unclassified Salinibacterium]QEE62275.1 DUF4166 domain-containing protein [Salinibacterium sp. dk2585]TXK53627.1 DUF4166 domain-containing protein [Salinibacterium sp. dk5596]